MIKHPEGLDCVATCDIVNDASERLRSLFAAMREGVVYLNAEGSIVECNESALRILGLTRDQLMGRTTYDERWKALRDDESDYPADEHPVAVTLRTGVPTEDIMGIQKPDGTRTWVSVSAEPLFANGSAAPHGVVASFADITARREEERARAKLQEQLYQTQRLEALGRLAGGIAHDFRNTFLAISLHLEILRRRDGQDPAVSRCIDVIRTSLARSSKITDELLSASRQQHLQPRVTDVRQLVEQTLALLESGIGESIRVETSFAEDPWSAEIDPEKIHQVLLNLVVNAAEAMPNGGRIVLETHNFTADAHYARRHPDVAPGEYVLLAVSDTGVGIPKERLSHIFDLFETTKGPGNSGLGLSVVYGIVKQSGGHIWAYSEAGRGTTFKILFPRHYDNVAPMPQSSDAPPPTGDETILVVEDYDILREIICETLRGAGFNVLESEGPKQAIKLATGRQIDLLLTDVVMPDMNGRELSLRIGAPRTLFMSGYTRDVIIHHGIIERGVHFIEKTFAANDLLRKVRDMLDA